MRNYKDDRSILEKAEVVSPWQLVRLKEGGAGRPDAAAAYTYQNLKHPVASLRWGYKPEVDNYFEDLLPATVNPPTCTISPGAVNRIGFEFDLLYSIASDFKKTTEIADKTIISHHIWDDPVSGDLADGFKLSVDGNKIEIATKPFELNANGKAELNKTFANIKRFVTALQSNISNKKISVDVKPAAACTDCPKGRGVVFETKNLPKFSAAVVNENSQLKIQDAFITPNHFIFPLKFPQKLKDYFTSDISVSGVPQATVGIPLASVSKLVDLIKESEKGRLGVRLTGRGEQRLGLRSDALFNAQFRVNASRAFFLRIGIFDGLTITKTNYSDTLTGFLILLVQYLWTTVLPVDSRDGEKFSKAYVPLHSKIRFREMFHCILTTDEKELFNKVYWEGDNWKNLFSLTRKIPGRAGGYTNIDDTKDNKLFPPQVVLPKVGPKWHDFVKSIVENDFSIEDTDASGNDTLVTGPTSALKLKTKAVIVELRRMGFTILSAGDWEKTATKLFDIGVTLNA